MPVPGSARRRFAPGTTADDLKRYMAPFVARLGYKFNTDAEFVDEVLKSEIEILDADGDVYCPCRVRIGDPKEDLKIICPCIPFHADRFAAMRKCWCGLFIRTDVEDGGELLGVIEDFEMGSKVDVPVARLEDIAEGSVCGVRIGKREIALVRTQGELFALAGVCRHTFGPLSDGLVDEFALICPWHGWRYDVRDGTTDHPSSHVATFPVSVRDGEVLVTVAIGR